MDINYIKDVSWVISSPQVIALISLVFTALNILMLYKTWQFTEGQRLFSIIKKNLDEAILILEKANGYRNDSFNWHVAANQLSAFHNLASNIKNYNLRKSYCAKLDHYTMRVHTLVSNVSSYLFYYGVDEFENMAPDFIKHKALRDKLYFDANSLNCIIQFLLIFHGARSDYMYNKKSLSYIFKPIIVGFYNNDRIPTRAELSSIDSPVLRNIYEYMVDVKEVIIESKGSKN